jgi:tetratricopeptide (TPR) repeat protein
MRLTASMDTRIIKILIAALSLAYTVYLFVTGNWGSGIGMIFVSAILVLINLRSLRMIVALFQLRKQDFAKARTWLDRVNPDKLWKKQQGYWYYLIGLTEVSTNLNSADKNFRKALQLGLNMDHDKAMAKLNMAMVAASRNKRNEAIQLINEAKRLDKRGMMKKDIKTIEQAIKNPRVVRQQGGGRR